jgi:hypothetical protein
MHFIKRKNIMQRQQMVVIKPSEWKKVNGGVYKDAFIPDDYMKPYGPYYQKTNRHDYFDHIVK